MKPTSPPLPAPALFVLLILCLGAACGCGGPEPGGAAQGGGASAGPAGLRSVLLVTVDTLRADRLGCYGGRSPQTPAYDRLAREGALFTNAIATNPLTLPAHVSILTGRSPLLHGVRGNGNFALPRGVPTLTQILRQDGLRTAAFVGAFPLAYRFGLGEGFEIYDDDFGAVLRPGTAGAEARAVPRSERRAREVNAKALAWLASMGTQGPFFVWVHYFDPHFEYLPEEPFASRYPGAPYDGEVAATDQALGELLEALDRLGLASSTIVVVAADHGESLGEHGEAFHGVFVYDATTRVPLIVRAPGRLAPGLRVNGVAGGADIAPTILALLGRPAPAGMSGRALEAQGAGEEGRGVITESYGPWFEFGWSPLVAWRTVGWKFIEAPEPELYDLASDPGETVNLAARDPERVAAMRGELSRAIAAVGPESGSAVRAVGEEEREHLASLGYASSGPAPRLPAAGAHLIDPKAMRGFEEQYYRAFTLLNLGRFEDAIREYRALAARAPDAPFVHHQLGRALRRTGAKAEAAGEFLAALRLSPGLAEAAFDLGALSEADGEREAAERWYRKALAINDAYPEAHASLARVRFAAGDRPGAESEIRRAIALDPTTTVYRQALASLIGPSSGRP